MSSNIKRLGLIAGNGTLPVFLAEEAASRGVKVISIVFSDRMIQPLKAFSEVYHLGIGQMGKILRTLKEKNIQHVALVGKIEKKILYSKPRLDVRTIFTLARLKDRKDNSIMYAVIEELAKEGMAVIEQSMFLNNMFVQKGLIAGKKPTKTQVKDIEFGLIIAKKIAKLDIGQTVVVKNCAVMAVEAIEGTDEAIKRGCRLCRKGGVVVKVEKPNQDPRFDIPTVGASTIQSMSENKGSLLAIESEKTIVVEKDVMVSAAINAGITVIAV